MKYSVSVLAYNRIDLTRKCVASVLANSGDNFELILTDNGSSDGTADYFRELHSQHPGRIVMVLSELNGGFVDPNRRALEMATGEWFVMLNNDATVPAGWLDRMAAVHAANPRAGIVGAKGSCQTIDRNMNGSPGPTLEYVEASCCMASVKLLRRIGLFSPELHFAYWEDVDLSLRLRELGYTIHTADFAIEHHRAATSSTIPNILEYQRRNGAYMRKRWAHYFKVRRFDYPTVVRRNAAWGDVLLTTPIIRELKRRRPLGPIWVETKCPDVFLNNPHVLTAMADCSDAGPDAEVIDLDMAYENRPGVHIVDAYADAAGIVKVPRIPEIHVPVESLEWAADELPGGWIAVHPGPTTWAGKNWSVQNWNRLVALLRAKYPVVLVGANASYGIQADRDLRGRTSVIELAAVLRQCRLLVTLDSFPLHVGQAVGTPVVGLFGVTLPEFIMTDGSPHMGVTADVAHPFAGARHRVAGATMVATESNPMATISVESVMFAVEEMLK